MITVIKKKYIIVCGVFFLIASIVYELAELHYKRSIEQFADTTALQLTQNYNGCLQMISRWQKTCGMPADNPYGGLLSDHPSCLERKNNCLLLQQTEEKLA